MEVWGDGHWKSAFALKRKRSGFGIVSVEHYIYIIGGNDGENILSSVEILNTLSGEWTTAEPMK